MQQIIRVGGTHPRVALTELRNLLRARRRQVCLQVHFAKATGQVVPRIAALLSIISCLRVPVSAGTRTEKTQGVRGRRTRVGHALTRFTEENFFCSE